MRTLTRSIFALGLMAGLTLAVAAPARAASGKQDNFKAQLGLALPIVGDLDDVADPGIILGGQWLHKLTAADSVGAQLDFIFFGSSHFDGVDVDADVISVQGVGRHNLAGGGGAQPYLQGGAGLARTKLTADVAAGPFGGTSSNDDTSFTFSFGGGVDIPLNPTVSLGLSAIYQHFLFDIGSVDSGGALELLAQLRF